MLVKYILCFCVENGGMSFCDCGGYERRVLKCSQKLEAGMPLLLLLLLLLSLSLLSLLMPLL
jgi:hypothetical protein